jgi:hypothetical protein
MVRRPVALTDPLLDGEQTEQPSTTLTTSGGYPSAGAARRHLTYRQGIVRWRNYTGRSPDPGQDGQEAGAGKFSAAPVSLAVRRVESTGVAPLQPRATRMARAGPLSATQLARSRRDGLPPTPAQLIEMRVEPGKDFAALPAVVLADLVEGRPSSLAGVAVQRRLLDLQQCADFLGRQDLVSHRRTRPFFPLFLCKAHRSSPPPPWR